MEPELGQVKPRIKTDAPLTRLAISSGAGMILAFFCGYGLGSVEVDEILTTVLVIVAVVMVLGGIIASVIGPRFLGIHE